MKHERDNFIFLELWFMLIGNYCLTYGGTNDKRNEIKKLLKRKKYIK